MFTYLHVIVVETFAPVFAKILTKFYFASNNFTNFEQKTELHLPCDLLQFCAQGICAELVRCTAQSHNTMSMHGSWTDW